MHASMDSPWADSARSRPRAWSGRRSRRRQPCRAAQGHSGPPPAPSLRFGAAIGPNASQSTRADVRLCHKLWAARLSPCRLLSPRPDPFVSRCPECGASKRSTRSVRRLPPPIGQRTLRPFDPSPRPARRPVTNNNGPPINRQVRARSRAIGGTDAAWNGRRRRPRLPSRATHSRPSRSPLHPPPPPPPRTKIHPTVAPPSPHRRPLPSPPGRTRFAAERSTDRVPYQCPTECPTDRHAGDGARGGDLL